MDFQLTPEEEAFRQEVRAFLDENLPDPVPQYDEVFLCSPSAGFGLQTLVS